jgi:hypothetical protein
MIAVFADTFYWLALGDANDSAHVRALELAWELSDRSIVTTDEVLSEYPTFFATAHEQLRPQSRY